MDVLLPILALLLFAPVVVRLVSESGSRAKAELHEPLQGLRQPGILLQLVGGVLFIGGIAFALATGRVERSISVGGVAGALLVVVATALLTWSLVALKSWRFLPTVAADHELCTSGPYALVRHPMYVAIDLLGLGLAIWVPGVPTALGAAAFVVGGDLRARAEEKVLLQSFGARYEEYMKRVRRTIPGVY